MSDRRKRDPWNVAPDAAKHHPASRKQSREAGQERREEKERPPIEWYTGALAASGGVRTKKYGLTRDGSSTRGVHDLWSLLEGKTCGGDLSDMAANLRRSKVRHEFVAPIRKRATGSDPVAPTTSHVLVGTMGISPFARREAFAKLATVSTTFLEATAALLPIDKWGSIAQKAYNLGKLRAGEKRIVEQILQHMKHPTGQPGERASGIVATETNFDHPKLKDPDDERLPEDDGTTYNVYKEILSRLQVIERAAAIYDKKTFKNEYGVDYRVHAGNTAVTSFMFLNPRSDRYNGFSDSGELTGYCRITLEDDFNCDVFVEPEGSVVPATQGQNRTVTIFPTRAKRIGIKSKRKQLIVGQEQQGIRIDEIKLDSATVSYSYRGEKKEEPLKDFYEFAEEIL